MTCKDHVVHVTHDGHDVGCRGAALVDDEVRVDVRDLRPPTEKPLRPQLSMSTPTERSPGLRKTEPHVALPVG